MKRKILFSLLVVLSLFLVVGCGSKNTTAENATSSNKDNDVVDNNKDTDTNKDDDNINIDLYSDDTKIVFASGEGKLVFYYEGDKITAYHAYIDYGSASLAQTAYTALNANEEDNIKKAYVKGHYLVVEYEDSEFEGLSLEDIRKSYSFLEEVQKKN